MQYRNRYLIYLQFLGFRYSGWQKQPGQKTLESMVRKTLEYVLGGRSFKLLGAGRTDAKVSALEYAFELFLDGDSLGESADFLQLFNKNLPPDIRALRMEEVRDEFNIIASCEEKEYLYFFAYGEKIHPFCAPFMAGLPEELDIQLMKETATCFQGRHDFKAYTVKDSGQKKTIRTLNYCAIEENRLLTANFFPGTTYLLRVRGRGFMRYQVRMIMGALISLGRGEISVSEIHSSLEVGNNAQFSYVAPGSGLVLNRILFS